MALASETGPLLSWNVQQLKDYLREHHLPLTGVKSDLAERVRDCLDTSFLETEMGAKSFQHFHDDSVVLPAFTSLPEGPWNKGGFPVVKEGDAKGYLQKKGGYTKNYQTGVRLCQCGHLYDIEMAQGEDVTYMRARCRPTMRKNPPFYFLFVMLDSNTKMPKGGNCFCAAGASQSCVHIAALLFTVAEVTATACTSVRCAWTRPSGGNKVAAASFSRELNFGSASQDGYFPYDGPKPLVDTLLKRFAEAGSKPAIIDFLDGEREREAKAEANTSHSVEVLRDPLDILASIAAIREPTVEDLVDALRVTVEEVELIQVMTIGQADNPLWLDARQWRITASNFGRVCNRNFRVLYPPSLKKIILGDYGRPNTAAINWGCEHENVALEAYQQRTATEVDVCGLFLSATFPFLGATPDGLVYTALGTIGIVEVKCPYKHRNSTIVDACEDAQFCLSINSDSGQPNLKRSHDYYYQIIGQLEITGAVYCDFVVWTLLDMHIERVLMDTEVWQEIIEKLKKYYCTELGPEIIQRLLNT